MCVAMRTPIYSIVRLREEITCKVAAGWKSNGWK